MSGQCSIWAWAQAERCESATQLLVLLKLADMAHDDGKVWPSHAYVARKTNLSERTVRSSVGRLEELGLLTTTPRPGRTDIIFLALTRIVIEPTSREEMEVLVAPRGRPKKRSAICEVTPAADDATPAPVADEPSNNLTGEPISSLRSESSASGELILFVEPDLIDLALKRIAVALDFTADPWIDYAFDCYNEVAKEIGIPAARDLTKDRRTKIRNKIKAVGLHGWLDALECLKHSPHCKGVNDRGWKADLDFLLQNKSFNRLVEGSYGDERNGDTRTRAPARGWGDQRADDLRSFFEPSAKARGYGD